MKKVLIITYYWPPAGGPGVQRWLKFVKYLPAYGIQPVVYIPENPHYPIQDPSFLDEIPEGTTIYKHPIFEPYRFAKLLSSKKTRRISSGIIQKKRQSLLERFMLWVRGNFFIPDARKYWVRPSVAYLSEVLKKEEIETIITTGPPHSVHLIGHGLKQRHPLQWITDFRDPWTSIGYHKQLKLTATSRRKHKTLERLVLNESDALITTSHVTKKEFEAITDTPITVITNGYDSEYSGGAPLDSKFTIAHVGSLLTGRNPINLWRVLSELANDDEGFRKELRLDFVGVVSKDVLDTIYRHELGPYVNFGGYLSHRQAVRKQRGSQILLLVEIDAAETRGIIPGKLFEYMAARRPILAVGPKEWEVGQLIGETGTGAVFHYAEESRLKEVILKWFMAYREGNLQMSATDIEKYSRKSLTGQLVKLL